ncbi:MAG: CPBP family intramembrane metalloprotease [Bacilli bacterium]|nr:CPBP family intramembrane metalloprotease [Bacilli bacterium]
MQKRIYFIISSFIQIIISILMIIYKSKVVQHVIQSYKDLQVDGNEEMWVESIKMYETDGEMLITVISTLSIIFGIAILWNLFRKKDKYSNGLILTLSIITLLTTESSILSILTIINILVCVWGNKKDKEDNLKKEENEEANIDENPKMKRITFGKNDIQLGILAIIIYIFLPEVIALLPLSYIPLSIILDVSLMVIYYVLFRKEVTEAFKNLMKNIKKYLNFVVNKQVAMFFVYILVGVVVTLIKGDDATSVNQQVAESLPMLYIVPMSVLYAPFVEEILFRGALRRFIKNDKLFILISGISFGLLHTLAEATVFDMLLLSLPYAILGSFFAYLYAKTNNITTSMMAHFFHNSLACVMMLLG